MNLDRNQLFPNQRTDRNPFECVGLSISDILGNHYGFPCDPDFSYALAFFMANQPLADSGVDPYAAMCAAVAYGVLPASQDTFSALTTSELYVANIKNYSAGQLTAAERLAPNGFKPLATYADVVAYLSRYQSGAILTGKWYAGFNSPSPDGTLRLPAAGEPWSEHAVACYELTDKGFRVKPWLGKDYGDGGYVYMSLPVFNAFYVSAFGFTADAWRWLSLVKIALTYPQHIKDILPLLQASSGTIKA